MKYVMCDLQCKTSDEPDFFVGSCFYDLTGDQHFEFGEFLGFLMPVQIQIQVSVICNLLLARAHRESTQAD